MKKLIILLLNLSIATCVLAGVPLKQVPKSLLQPTSKMAKFNKAPITSCQLNTPTTGIIAPTITPKDLPTQHQVIPCQGLRVLERPRNVVTEQPEGTEVYYRRAGTAMFPVYQQSTWYYSGGNQDGFLLTVENGNQIWFKNLMYDPYGYLGDYWIHGTKSGNTITIPLNQDINYNSAYNAYIRLGWGSIQVSGNDLNFTRNSRKLNATFTVNGDVLTLDDTSFSGNYTGQGLAVYWSDDDTFGGEALYTTTLTMMDGDIPEAPIIYTDVDIEALDGEWVAYNRIGYSIYQNDEGLQLGEQKSYDYVFYEADGKTVYMRNPIYGWSNDVWVKGYIDGNTLIFPLYQYIYWDNSLYGIRTTWGTFVEGEGFYEDTGVYEVTYTVADDYLIMDNAGMNEEQTAFVGQALSLDSAYIDLGWFGYLDFMTVFYNIPNTPTGVSVNPDVTTANVTWQDEENIMWNVRYRQWVDPETSNYFFDDFDGEFTEWLNCDLDGDGYTWQSVQAEDGNIYLASASYINQVGPLNPDNWLISPELTLNGVVRFNAWGIDPNYADEVFKVYIYAGNVADIMNPETDFIAISDDVLSTGEKTEYTFAIPEEYQGLTGYIAIRHYNVTDQFWLAVDDIFVGDPENIYSWTCVDGIETPKVVLDGLTPETTYELQVQSTNYGGAGLWSETVLFTTLAQEPEPEPEPDGQNHFVIGDTEVLHGETVVIPVSMINADKITAFQADLYLPEGFSILTDENDEPMITPTSRVGNHDFLTNVMGDGAVRIISYSTNLDVYEGHEGAMFYITVQAPDDSYGAFNIELRNCRMTTDSFAELNGQDAIGVINVLPYILGDANDSHSVTVTDIVWVAQHILGLNPEPFIFGAADVNKNNEITVTDAVLIANMVLNPGWQPNPMMRAAAPWHINDAMSSMGVNLSDGHTGVVTIALDNEIDYTAFQLDLLLPEGLTADNFMLTDRAGSHALEVNTLDNGKLRLLCYSPQLTGIDGNEGALLTFEVAASNLITGDIMVDGIEMVSADCQTVYLNDFSIQVNAGGMTSVKDITSELRIYTDGHDIIVESPVSQRVIISDVTGRAYSVDVTAGRNVIPAHSTGVVIVTTREKTAKLMVK